MSHPCPNLQEILALEAKLHVDQHDLYPYAKGYWDMRLHTAAEYEALLQHAVIYAKKK